MQIILLFHEDAERNKEEGKKSVQIMNNKIVIEEIQVS